MTEAAELARGQALQLLRLQQEVARIDRLAEGESQEPCASHLRWPIRYPIS